jgi:hypothetical protein
MGTKICTKCGAEKFLSEFPKNKSKGGGFNTWCKKCMNDYKKIHSEEFKKYNKEYRLKNSTKIKEYQCKYDKVYRQKNAEKIKIKRRKYKSEWEKNKKRIDPNYKLNSSMARSIRMSLKGKKNGQHWENIVGYSLDNLKKHLERQFKDGMTWDNYGRGGWHIDHKIPISIFNIDGIKSKGFKKCWALENLQPMWEKENIIKRDKLFAA